MAAQNNVTNELALFKLVLQLIERYEPFDRAAFGEYFSVLLSRALLVAENPRDAIDSLSPDVIQLALAIARNPSLKDELQHIHTVSDLSSEMATRIRKGVEQLAA